MAGELVKDHFHECVLIYSGLNQSNIANLGCIVKASNPLSRTVLGCIVTDPQLRLGEEHVLTAKIGKGPKENFPLELG